MSDKLLERLMTQRTTLAFKSGNNKIFFEYVADNKFHEKTMNDIIELMKEKEER